jgi:hypothetical protein
MRLQIGKIYTKNDKKLKQIWYATVPLSLKAYFFRCNKIKLKKTYIFIVMIVLSLL